jgi:hypothetical protein
MSRWNHSMCEDCWNARNPDRRVPVRARYPQEELCCYCGRKHSSGIYYRDDPKNVACKGEGPAHAD